MPARFAVRDRSQFATLRRLWLRRVLFDTEPIGDDFLSSVQANDCPRSRQTEAISAAVGPWAGEPIASLAAARVAALPRYVRRVAEVAPLRRWRRSVAEYRAALDAVAALRRALAVPLRRQPDAGAFVFRQVNPLADGRVADKGDGGAERALMVDVVHPTVMNFRAGAFLGCFGLLFQAGRLDHLHDDAVANLLDALHLPRLVLVLVGQPAVARRPLVDLPEGRARLFVAAQRGVAECRLARVGASLVVEELVRSLSNAANDGRESASAARLAASAKAHHLPHVAMLPTLAA